jgi:transposase
VAVPSRAQREERELLRERERALKHLKGVKNEIHGFLKFHGIAYSNKGSWSKAWLEAVETAVARRDTTGHLKEVFAFKLASYHHLKTILGDLTKAAKRLFKEGACAMVAQAIARADGVGWLSAVTIAVETPDFLAFKNSEAYASSTGTVPSESSSGDSVRRGAITRAGNRHVRRVLTECAWIWIRKDKEAAKTYYRIKGGKDSRKKIAIVAMMRRLAVKIYHLAKNALLDQLSIQQPAAA